MLKCKFGLLIRIYKWKIVKICCRSPRGNVDWNECIILLSCFVAVSFPTRERGLKWSVPGYLTEVSCRSPRGNVDWNNSYRCINQHGRVVPHAGTWIEIISGSSRTFLYLSFPTRERGLKFKKLWKPFQDAWVVPHAGTWIEIANNRHDYWNPFSRSPRGNVDWNRLLSTMLANV